MTPRNAAIYCRLSYAPDGSLEKVERQEADCRALAKQLGWTIRDVYPDNSRSAWQRNRKRPQWDRMLADIKAGLVDGIIVYHGDRLMRQPKDLEQLLELADERQLRLASPSGTRDLDNEDHRYILRIEVAAACKSSADTSRRVKRASKARAEQGRPSGGGKRPFGYGVPTGKTGRTGRPLHDITQQVPEEAAVLRDAVDRLLAGHSKGAVVRWMNTVSTTTEGGRWNGRNLGHLLNNPRIAGLIEHDGQLHTAAWEPIVTRDQWEDVRALMARNGDTYGYHGRERRYLLAGAAECSGCGKGMSTKPSGGRNRKTSRLYYCRNPQCPAQVSRNVEHLDEYVTGRVLRRLNEPGFLDQLHAADDQPGIGAEIVALERRKDDARRTLEELADHPDVDPALLMLSLASFDRKITALRGQLATSARDRLLRRVAGISREAWDAEPVDVRAEVVRALFRVTVLPATWRGPGFDPDSVTLERV